MKPTLKPSFKVVRLAHAGCRRSSRARCPSSTTRPASSPSSSRARRSTPSSSAPSPRGALAPPGHSPRSRPFLAPRKQPLTGRRWKTVPDCHCPATASPGLMIRKCPRFGPPTLDCGMLAGECPTRQRPKGKCTRHRSLGSDLEEQARKRSALILCGATAGPTPSFTS